MVSRHTWFNYLDVGFWEQSRFAGSDNGAIPPVSTTLRRIGYDDKVFSESWMKQKLLVTEISQVTSNTHRGPRDHHPQKHTMNELGVLVKYVKRKTSIGHEGKAYGWICQYQP